MFVGRQRELDTLNKLYQTDRFQFAVIYGRRRVGKTALIGEFLRGKDAIFFTGVETNEKQNLDNFSQCVLAARPGAAPGSVFVSFQAALEYVFSLAETRRLVLVIDEYPYVARAAKSLASTLQMLIDRHKDTSRLFLILCGSSMSYMEDEVLTYKAPLYGRRTAQFRLQPFDFFDARHILPRLAPQDMALAYGVVGGTPQYLLQLDDGLDMAQNIQNTHLNPASILFEEPLNLLKQEVREAAIYNAILTAIAAGCSKMNEIAGKVGEETGACAVYIKNLLALGIVKKELPYGQKTTRKTIYAIADNMFRFWYRFVPQNLSVITRGAAEVAYRRIAPELPTYMGAVFEEICRQYLWRLLLTDRCAVPFGDLGRWWGTDPKTHTQQEIDIMGADGDAALFCECKWTNEKVDLAVLETLLQRGELFRYPDKHFYLFAKSGFTPACQQKAAVLGRVHLVSYADMLREI